jgi:hypothetical protein
MPAQVPIVQPIESTRMGFEFKIEPKSLTRKNSDSFDLSIYRNALLGESCLLDVDGKTRSLVVFKKVPESEPTHKSSREIFIATKEDFRFTLLRKQFDEEIENSLIETSFNIEKTFELMTKELRKINFIESVIEITPSSSLKFTLLIDGDRMVMVSKSFETFEDQPSEDIVIFSFFIQRKLIVSNAIEIKAFVKGINEYLTA